MSHELIMIVINVNSQQLINLRFEDRWVNFYCVMSELGSVCKPLVSVRHVHFAIDLCEIDFHFLNPICVFKNTNKIIFNINNKVQLHNQRDRCPINIVWYIFRTLFHYLICQISVYMIQKIFLIQKICKFWNLTWTKLVFVI